MSTGQKIKELRLQRNLTQEYLATQLGMSMQGYSKIENDQTDVNLSRLKKIAKERGVSVGHLAEDDKMIVNYYGEIKDGGNTVNDIEIYHQENAEIVNILQAENQRLREEIQFWKEKQQQEQDKHQQELAYYKSIIDRVLGEK